MMDGGLPMAAACRLGNFAHREEDPTPESHLNYQVEKGRLERKARNEEASGISNVAHLFQPIGDIFAADSLHMTEG